MTYDLKEIVIASHNKGKVREISKLLAPYGVTIHSAADFNLEAPEETGSTFEANALLKAKAASDVIKKPVLADDSGIEVALLDGDPGIYSARWAGDDGDFNLAMSRVWSEVNEIRGGDTTPPVANFICVLCLALPDGTQRFYEGKIYGTLVWPPRGDKGFGYDPMFTPDGYDQTFGEIASDLKQRISHRALAFEKFVKDCFLPDDQK